MKKELKVSLKQAFPLTGNASSSDFDQIIYMKLKRDMRSDLSITEIKNMFEITLHGRE